ncbi:MAG: glycosyltransferase family 2 protein [Paracoccaceae bacterium]
MNKPDSHPQPCRPLVSVIVVSYGTRDLTVRAVTSSLAGTSLPVEVIVVDNGSTDGTADAITAIGKPVRLIARGRNIGFGRACNLASEEARGRYLLLLNSDTVCRPGAIDRLVAFAGANPGARIWGGRTLYEDGRLNPNSCWRAKSVWSLFCSAVGLSAALRGSRLFNPETYPDWRRDTVREVDIVSGCFFLTERSFWQSLGGFDPRYFLYGEEADFCARARRAGARPLFTPEAAIVHIEQASSRSPASRLAYLLAAQITLCRTHMRGPAQALSVGLIRSGVMLRLAVWSVCRLGGGGRRVEGLSRWAEVARRRTEWWNGYT